MKYEREELCYIMKRENVLSQCSRSRYAKPDSATTHSCCASGGAFELSIFQTEVIAQRVDLPKQPAHLILQTQSWRAEVGHHRDILQAHDLPAVRYPLIPATKITTNAEV